MREDQSRTQTTTSVIMDSTTKSKEQLHVAMFPWLAFGHLLPYLELAKRIAHKGHRVSFISTPKNIQRLPKLPRNLAPLINLVQLPLPRVDGLPENAEATTDIPYHKLQYLSKASNGLQESVTEFSEASTPDWILYDFSAHWLPPIAKKLGIMRVFFSIGNAWTMSFFASSSKNAEYRSKPEDFTVPPKWIPFPSNLAYRQSEARKLLEKVRNEFKSSDGFHVDLVVSGCDVLALRSCMEFESNWLRLLGELHQKPVIPVGLFPPLTQETGVNNENMFPGIGEWLDKQDKGSMVYIALGSEVPLSQDELTELALGLELSGLPFFWALRKRFGLCEGDLIELPEGFEDRTKCRGFVWTSWAPQLKILAHDSVGAFLSHCGCSSLIEGLLYGRPLVTLPIMGDQGLNARIMEEKKVGREIPRHEQNGSFTRNSVAETLRFVVVEEGGKTYRANAKEMQKMVGDEGLHDRYMDDFIDYLQQHRKST